MLLESGHVTVLLTLSDMPSKQPPPPQPPQLNSSEPAQGPHTIANQAQVSLAPNPLRGTNSTKSITISGQWPSKGEDSY